MLKSILSPERFIELAGNEKEVMFYMGRNPGSIEKMKPALEDNSIE